ncbi:hypothetical protein ABPG75_005098 [Micractinium tetrahymenae]
MEREAQGVPAKEAGRIAERLAAAFGGDQQAALLSLPATFAWCRGRQLSSGRCLTGLEVAWRLYRIARRRRENVTNFAGTARPDWQLIDSYIEVHLRQQEQKQQQEEEEEGVGGGGKLRRHASLADALRGDASAALALVRPPGHVKAWLTAVTQHMSRADVGALLLAQPKVVTGSPETPLASISWAQRELGVTDVSAFFRRAPGLLMHTTTNLRQNLDGLLGSLQAAGLTAEQVRQLVMKRPQLLDMESERVKSTVAWLQHFFFTPQQLCKALESGPHLLTRSSEQLQGQADRLQQQLGWDSRRVAEFATAYPQPFATVDLSKPDTGAKLRFLTEVVGVASEEECITGCSTYLKTSLETMAALYALFCEQAPQLLLRRDASGRPTLSWMVVSEPRLRRCGLSKQQVNEHVLTWPASQEGQRLLEELRAGKTARWLELVARVEAAQQQQLSVAGKHSTSISKAAAAATAAAGTRRGRPRKHAPQRPEP